MIDERGLQVAVDEFRTKHASNGGNLALRHPGLESYQNASRLRSPSKVDRSIP